MCIATETYAHIQIKHLQYMSKADETFETYTCNIRVYPLQHIQHLDETYAM
jgi:hypothetical protein